MTKGVKQELFIPLRDKLMGWNYQWNNVDLDGELKNQVEDGHPQSVTTTANHDNPKGKISADDPGWMTVRPRGKHGNESQLPVLGVTMGVKTSHTGNNN